MRILIDDEPIEITVDIESRSSPCLDCSHYAAGSSTSPSRCSVEDRPLSGSVIESCTRLGWFEAAK